MTRRERVSRYRVGSNDAKKVHKPFQSTYWNFLILPVVLTIGLWIRMSVPFIEEATTVRSVHGSSYVSPLPQPSPSLPSEKVSPTPTPTIRQDSRKVTLGGGVEAFIRRVHMLESTAGQNTNPYALHNICKAQGGSNPYGYGGMAMMICFDSFEEATARVERWYHEHRAQMSEAMTYCYYNLGLKIEDCPYWEKAREL